MKASNWGGLTPDPSRYFGFIYRITDVDTSRMYVGKKQYHSAISNVYGCKTKVTDRQNPKWKDKCWKESNWKSYKGSSKEFSKHMKENPTHKYKYEILYQCRSRQELHYKELKVLWDLDVLTTKLPNGDYQYFNQGIGAIKFRPREYQDDN